MLAGRAKYILGVLGVGVVVLLAVIVAGGGSKKSYEIKTELDNAAGLRSGSLVTAGGVQIGKATVKLAKDDKVLITAKLDAGKGPVGKGASMAITSVNLLGQKRLEVEKGDVKQPLPSGSMLPASKVTESTDLDQILAVLTPDVRARLDMLINQAGGTVMDRSNNISELVGELPHTLAAATRTLDQVVGDNDRLKSLVTSSDSLVANLSSQRVAIGRLVDSAGQSAATADGKHAQLAQTLHDAPTLLVSAQNFLDQLKQTTVPLGPAARDIADVAPQLQSTLDQVTPFQKAARPTLHEAERVAPTLSKLALGATPTIKKTAPVVHHLATFGADIEPLTATLDKSSDNLIGTVDNWSRAVQYRDGISHIFRGEAGFTPQTFEGLLQRYIDGLNLPSARKKDDKGAGKKPLLPDTPGSKSDDTGAPATTGNATVDKVTGAATDTVKKVAGGVIGAVDQALHPQPPAAPSGGSDSADKGLLDYLLKP